MEALDNTREAIRINHDLIRKIQEVKQDKGVNSPFGFDKWFKQLFKKGRK